MTAPEVPRLVPDQPFPPYAYVPGRFPHPVSDPAGHSFGLEMPRPPRLDPESWQGSRAYLHGIDLFNHGYYWEAHETWEGLWHACGRKGVTADFLKGLIRLAAAGVKARAGNPEGVRSHARNAAQLFEEVARQLGAGTPCYLGLALSDLVSLASEFVESPGVASTTIRLRPQGVNPR
jgi:hypothetical protein